MKTVLLGDVCDIQIGGTPSRSDPLLWDTERQTDNVWVSIADLKKLDGVAINDSKEYISDKAKSTLKKVGEGTLLVSFKLTLGRLAFAGRDLSTNEAIAALTIKNESEVDKNYLYYYLKFFDWEEAASGDEKVKGKTLNKAKLKSLKISYPESIEEQRRIVKKLGAVFAAIDKAKQNTEKNLQNSSELFNGILKDEFDKELDKFELEEIGRIFSFKNGRSFGKSEWSKEGLPIIRIQNLKNPNAEFNHYKGEYSKDIEVEDGDLLFSWSGTVGSSFGPHFWHGPTAALNQHIFKLNKLVTINEIYAYFALKLITSEIEKRTHGAGGLVHVTKPTLQKFEIPLPPLDDQLRIAKYLGEAQDKSRRLENLYQKKLLALEELRQSILKQTLEGKL